MRSLQYLGIQRPWCPHPRRRLRVVPVGVVRVWMYENTAVMFVNHNVYVSRSCDEWYLRERTSVNNKPGYKRAHLVRSKHVHLEHRGWVGSYGFVPKPVDTKLEKRKSGPSHITNKTAWKSLFTSGNSRLIRSWSSFANLASSG